MNERMLNSGRIRVPVRTTDKRYPDESEHLSSSQHETREQSDRAGEWRERYARLLAELENRKKRLDRQSTSQVEQQKEQLFRDMLPLADNLERALAHTTEVDSDSGLREGVELTLQAFHEALNRHGVKAVEAIGMRFDPELHDAIGIMRVSNLPSGTVAHVEQDGYTIGAKLLRPARVLVTP